MELSLRRRGHGGISILWRRELSHLVGKVCDVSNERIQAITFDGICLINVYMPSGDSQQAIFDFRECLDLISVVMEKFSDFKIVISGDFNASLVRDKPKDKIFQEFCSVHGLHNKLGHEVMTYFHTGRNVCSQIDYVLCNCPPLVLCVDALPEDPSNTSCHRPLESKLEYRVCMSKPKKRSVYTKRVVLPEFDDFGKIANVFQELIPDELLVSADPAGIEAAATCLMDCITGCFEITGHIVDKSKFSGPKRRVNEQTLQKIKHYKKCLSSWTEGGKPPLPHPLADAKRLAKISVRSAMRQEDVRSTKEFLEDISHNANNKNFHKLIRKQKGAGSKPPLAMVSQSGDLIFDVDEQVKDWWTYFVDLSNPSDASPGMDIRYLILLEELSKAGPVHSFTTNEIAYAIMELNTGKAADEFGIIAEQLKILRECISQILTRLLNAIAEAKYVPQCFKSGIMNPVPKKGKDNKIKGNSRGISITSLIGKVLETCLKNRRNPLQRVAQSDLQFGFTESLAPTLASILLYESIVVAEEDNRQLYVCTLDARKAFDVVRHEKLLTKLHDSSSVDDISQIDLIKEIYTGMSARVKWKEKFSEPFQITQGVRQGGILSTGLYKSFIDPLLHLMKVNSIGLTLGECFIGTPTVADDVLLLTEDETELQVMLNVVDDYAKTNHYSLHPGKCEVFGITKREGLDWTLGGHSLPQPGKVTHLGLDIYPSSAKTANTLVTDRISLARRTAYSLMGCGLHGLNGLPPPVSLHVFNSYVLPRLLYGLEVVHLNNTNIKILTTYHNRTLKRLQSLPLRCANVSLYILLGCLPVIAYIHSKRLITLGSIIRCESRLLHDICVYQCSLREVESKSWFVQTVRLLHHYDLPSLQQLIDDPPRKSRWKDMVDRAVLSYWTEYVRDTAQGLPTLCHLNTDDIDLKNPHILWSSINCDSKDLRRGQIKAQMVTGTYMSFSIQSKFSKGKISPHCRLCGAASEDVIHILLDCPALFEPRSIHLPRVRDAVISAVGVEAWQLVCIPDLVQLLLDLTVLPLKTPKQYVPIIESETRKYVFSVHCRRIHLLDTVQSIPNPIPRPCLPPTESICTHNQTSRAADNAEHLAQLVRGPTQRT